MYAKIEFHELQTKSKLWLTEKTGKAQSISHEADREIARRLKLLDEIILEYKTDNYQNAANLIWKEILQEG